MINPRQLINQLRVAHFIPTPPNAFNTYLHYSKDFPVCELLQPSPNFYGSNFNSPVTPYIAVIPCQKSTGYPQSCDACDLPLRGRLEEYTACSPERTQINDWLFFLDHSSNFRLGKRLTPNFATDQSYQLNPLGNNWSIYF